MTIDPTVSAWPQQAIRRRYRIYGLAIESTIALPGLAVVAAAPGPADLSIERGILPTIPAGQRIAPNAWRDGDAVLLQPGTGRCYRVQAGHRVVADAVPAVDPGRLGADLLGLVLGVVLIQRGLLALHASAVATAGGCVAFLAPSGTGKSTLAAALNDRGYPLICDDACVIETAPPEPRVHPGARIHKLWAETLDATDRRDTAIPIDTEIDKYYVPARGNTADDDRPRRLLRLYRLTAQPGPIRRLRGIEAFMALTRNLHGLEFHRHLHGEQRTVEHRVALLRQTPVYDLPMRRGFDCLAEEILKLERHLAIEPPGSAAA